MKKLMLAFLIFCGFCYANDVKFISSLKHDCDSDYANSCSALGYIYYAGDGAKQDFAQALKYYTKGCDGNDAISCIGAGIIYYKGEGVSEDLDKAKEFFTKSCALKDKMGCTLVQTYDKL